MLLRYSDGQSRYGRIADLVDVSTFSRRRMTAIGCGSMSQPVVNQMVRHGLATEAPGWLRLIDGDDVEPRNLIGTEYLGKHIGMPKALAAASIAKEIDPSVNVSYLNEFITDDNIDTVVNLAAKSDLLGLFADSFEIMLRVAAACENVCPQVMAIYGPRADYAEVAFSIPGVTQPLARTIGQRQRQSIKEPMALGCDTAFVANFVAALCLRLLLGDSMGSDLFPCYADAPLFIVGLRRAWIFSNQPEDVARSILLVQAQSEEKQR